MHSYTRKAEKHSQPESQNDLIRREHEEQSQILEGDDIVSEDSDDEAVKSSGNLEGTQCHRKASLDSKPKAVLKDVVIQPQIDVIEID